MKIENGFLIVSEGDTGETTYQELADFLIADDPAGVTDLIYLLIEKKPELQKEIAAWVF